MLLFVYNIVSGGGVRITYYTNHVLYLLPTRLIRLRNLSSHVEETKAGTPFLSEYNLVNQQLFLRVFRFNAMQEPGE